MAQVLPVILVGSLSIIEIAAALWRWQHGRIRQLQSKDHGGSVPG
jgi:hypothetical protein